MKKIILKTTILFYAILLLGGTISAQSKDFKQKMILNNIRTADIIVTAQVVEKEHKLDMHDSKLETVTLKVNEVIEGHVKNDTIKIGYYVNQISDELFVIPKFEQGEIYILILYQDINDNYTLLGGELGKFHLGRDKVNNVNFAKSEFIFLLKRIRNNIQSDDDLVALNDLAGEMDGRLKLDGEFAIIHPDFHNKPKGSTITFYINPAGAKDKNGNQLSFNQVYNAISNAVAAWNSVACSYTVFSLSSTQYYNPRGQANGISTITFESFYDLPNGSGFPVSLYSEINEYDIVFNSSLRWNTESTYPSSYPTYAAPSYAPYLTYPTIGPVDLQDVATHELGHPVGLADIWGYDFTMHPTDYTVNEWWERTSRRNLGMGDKAGKIYMDPDFVSSISQPTSKLLLSNNFITEFNGNFTVPSGYYLEIEPLKNLTFSSGASLIINGTFKAVGEPFPNSTSFDRKSTGYWGGIILNSSSTATIRNCYIAYANTGITCNNNSNAQIFDCIISDRTNNGIYLNNSSPTINNCTISNNTNKGIYAYNSSPTIKYSTLDNNNTGVYCDYYSSPTMVGNNIRYNTSVGIYCSTGSSPNLTDNGASGSNVIRNNGTNGGFYAQYNCVPDLSGYYSTGNSIFDNTGYELRAYYGCIIDATRIWWGSSDPAVVATYLYSNYSTINYLPILTSNPNPNRNIVPTESNDKTPIFATASVQIDELELAKQ